MKKTICVDFDGVLHLYTSGWKGVDVIPDQPVPGAMEWLFDVSMDYEICIYSSRSKSPTGLAAMEKWLEQELVSKFGKAGASTVTSKLLFPTEKPAAWLTIDDRAICFRGTFPSVTEIENFKPWNK